MIETPDALRAHLQTAVEIEWSTIPPYLCALWSLGDEHNQEAAACIRDVVMAMTPTRIVLTLPMRPLRTSSTACRNLPPYSLRCWLPVWSWVTGS